MSEQIIILECGNLIDGTGSEARENICIAIKEGKVCFDPEIINNASAPKINLRDKFVMPGLIDSHIHFMGVINQDPLVYLAEENGLRAMRAVLDAERLLQYGYTTVRDCGTSAGISFQLKRLIQEKSIQGPRIVACGALISQTGGHADMAHSLPLDFVMERGVGRYADGEAECRKAVREQLRAGADFIKICTTGGVLSDKDQPNNCQFSVGEIAAMAEEAHNAGLKIASHAQGNRGIRNALQGGVDTIEHGFYLDDEVIEIMRERGVNYVPTLAIMDDMVTHGREQGLPERSFEKAVTSYEHHIASFKAATRAGLIIGCGSDYNGSVITPMGRNAKELALQVAYGRDPMEVLVSATKVNAQILGVDHLTGTLEEGKAADLIVLDGDPLADVTILQDKEKIVHVFKEGELAAGRALP